MKENEKGVDSQGYHDENVEAAKQDLDIYFTRRSPHISVQPMYWHQIGAHTANIKLGLRNPTQTMN